MTYPKALGRRAAFSLTELAIVVGVIGLVLAGIWPLVTNTIENQHEEQAEEAVSTVVNATRAFASGQSYISAPTGERGFMSQLVKAGTIPHYMIRPDQSSCTAGTTCVDSPWGPTQYSGSSLSVVDSLGTFRVFPTTAGFTTCDTTNCTGDFIFFDVSFRNLTVRSCVAMIEYLASPKGPSGLTDIIINHVSMAAAGKFTIHIPASTANTYCAPTAGNTQSIVTFQYNLGIGS